MYQETYVRPLVYPSPEDSNIDGDHIICDWKILRSQLMYQWSRLTKEEMDEAGPSKYRLACLISRKYDVPLQYIEQYLRNYERTMPL